MKTPMQEVYENFNLMSDADFKSWMLNTDLLEKEKEVMCEFADDYQRNCFQKSADDYFKETFNTNER
jgi:PHD/YefM family antitoxin component YafN of YafNO toxin-antitoxin module